MQKLKVIYIYGMTVVKAMMRRYERNSEEYSDYNISDQTGNHLSDRNQGVVCYTE